MGGIGRVLLLWSTVATAARAQTLIVEDGKGAHRTPLVFKSCSDGECADADSGPLSAHVVKTGESIRAELEWKQLHWLHRAAVELNFPPGELRVIGRDLTPRVVKKAILERFDPKWVTIGATTLLVDDEIDEVTVESRPKATVVTLELDAAAARPFVHDARCAHKWQDPNRHVPVPLRLRVPSEKVSARVQILGKATPLVKSLWPDGRRAALVFTDHADQTTLRTLSALARAFIAHHVVFTKALFAKGSDRPQLDDPRMVALADEMAAAGNEIVPHSATPKPDERSVTVEALDRFGRWLTKTWIDHQPETNCEAFGDEGYQSGGRFGIADLLASHHYEYVWAEDDALPGDLNLLAPAHPEHRAPTVWPLGRVSLGGPETLWMFRTMWAFLEAKRFYAMYGADKLDRLERERGLHIAHTYLDTYHRRGTRFGMRNVLVPADKTGVPGGPGAVKIDPRMDALLGSLEARQKRGSLWVPTLAQLADRMRLMASVTLSAREDGYLLRAPAAVPGATFVVPRSSVEILVDGKPPKQVIAGDGETTFVCDLSAGDTEVTIKATAP